MPQRYWSLADGRIGTVTSVKSSNGLTDVYFVCADNFESLRNSLIYISLLTFLSETEIREASDMSFSQFRVFLIGSGNEEAVMSRDLFIYLLSKLQAVEIA